jgi:GDP-L-fucose synthase
VTILVTGATGFLGKRVCRKLEARGVEFEKTSKSLGVDLRDQAATRALLERVRPKTVLNCASYVGGITYGYKHPADLFRNNLLMNVSLMEAAVAAEVGRIVNPVSNCVYPAAKTLFREEEIWDGPMHESVMVYGFVRKAWLLGAWAYKRQGGLDILNLILSNMYGPEDHFEAERSHALGALVMKFVEAKASGAPFVDVWGTGKPVREWLYVDDGAEAMVRGVDAASTEGPVNVGVAEGVSVIDLAERIRDAVGYKGEIRLSPDKPDGAPYKTVEGSRGEKLLGWKPATSLDAGIRETVDWYLSMREGLPKAPAS